MAGSDGEINGRISVPRTINPSSEILTCNQLSEINRFPCRELPTELDGPFVLRGSDHVERETPDDRQELYRGAILALTRSDEDNSGAWPIRR